MSTVAVTAIGIVTAATVEAAPLLARRARPGELTRLARSGWLKLSGTGRSRATQAAEALLAAGAQALLSWGVAGGLDPRLAGGTVLVPDAVIAADGRMFCAGREWRALTLQRLERCVTLAAGPLAESVRVLTTAEEKLALGASCGAVAVDMESAAVAEVALAAEVPFLAIRAILDTAHEALPSCVTRALGENGGVALTRLGVALAARPSELIQVVGIAKSLRRAQAALETVARTMELR